YLDLAAPEWLTAGLPVVGYFHDNDLSPGGLEWLRDRLDEWTAAGVERMLDFRELAGVLGLELELGTRDGCPLLTVTRREGAPPPVRPVPVRLERCAGAQLDVRLDGRELVLPIDRRRGEARVFLPAA